MGKGPAWACGQVCVSCTQRYLKSATSTVSRRRQCLGTGLSAAAVMRCMDDGAIASTQPAQCSVTPVDGDVTMCSQKAAHQRTSINVVLAGEQGAVAMGVCRQYHRLPRGGCRHKLGQWRMRELHGVARLPHDRKWIGGMRRKVQGVCAWYPRERTLATAHGHGCHAIRAS